MGKKEPPRSGLSGGGTRHRRTMGPGYPSVGLRARRARLRFARHKEDSAKGQRSKAGQRRKHQEEPSGRQDGAMAAARKVREEWKVAPGGPELSVLRVKVRVH